jgi:F-type H+-transporting ATPase subunit delta
MNSAISRRYAQALLMIATERQALDQFEGELETFRNALMTNPGVKELMDNPRILAQEKKKALDLLIKDLVDPVIYNFLHLIVDKRREAYFLDIIRAFNKYADEARNIIDAEVRSVVQLTDKDYQELREKLARASGKNVRLKSIVDTSLIGGIKVKIGDTVLDGSVTKKLSLLKNRLSKTRLEEIGVKK